MNAVSTLHRTVVHVAAACIVAAISPRSAPAATPLATLSISTDTTVALGSLTVTDEDVTLDDLVGGTGAVALGPLPTETAIVAYHRTVDGDHLIVLETTAALGSVTATPADVVRLDGGLVASLELDGSAIGIPPGVGIDALTLDGGHYLLSFDVTVPLGGTTFDDEDLARWDGSGFGLAFDGSEQGVDPALDLDAAHLLENGHLLLSFDGSAVIGGVAAADEDVLELSSGPVWELAFDGSAAHAGLAGTNTDALFADVHVLDVGSSGSGSGTITSPSGIDCGLDCTEILAPGTVVTLTATADAGSTFTGWTGVSCGLSTTCDVTIDADLPVVGAFTLDGDLIFLDGFETGNTSRWN